MKDPAIYSQCGEDTILLSLVRNYIGRDYDFSRFFYVDIGASDPEKFSNTKMFYDLGGRGLAVEPNLDLAARYSQSRPDDHLVCAAAATHIDQNSTTLIRTNNPLVSSTDRDFIRRFVEKKGGGVEIVDEVQVPVVDVNPIIRKIIGDRDFGLLSIDVEGSDLDVLRLVDLCVLSPWFIIAEPSVEIIGEEEERRQDAYLKSAGYLKISRTRVNSIYCSAKVIGRRNRQNFTDLIASKSGEVEGSIKSGKVELADGRHQRIRAAIESPGVKYVSFDVFDTMVFRPFLEPHELFELLDEPARDILGAKNFHFSSARRRVERSIRKERDATGMMTDPNLAEIYAEMGRFYNLEIEDLNTLRQMEIGLEIRLCYRNEAVFDLYKCCQEQGKRVVFVSDTYLDAYTIRAILARSGVSTYQEMFLSSELSATKKHGNIFPLVVRALGVAPNEIVHIGDNRISDDINGRKNGLKTFHIPSPRDRITYREHPIRKAWISFDPLDLHTRSSIALSANRQIRSTFIHDTPSSLFGASYNNFGYSALGPFLLWMTRWVQRASRDNNVDHIFFLSRDGHLPMKAWSILFADSSNLPSVSYLYASRRAFSPLNVKYGSLVAEIESVHAHSDISVEEFLDQRFGGAVAKAFAEGAPENGARLCEPYAQHAGAVLNYMRENEQVVRELLAERAAHAEAYLKSQFDGKVRPAVFDVGRKGSFQNMIRRVIHPDAFGLYVLTQGKIVQNIPEHAYAAAFPQTTPRHHLAEPDTVLYEALFSDVGPSVVGWDGKGAPIFDVRTAADVLSAEKISDIQNGALAFIADYRAAFGERLDSFTHNRDSANYLLSNFWKSEEDARLFDTICHEDGLSRKDRRSLRHYYKHKTTQSVKQTPALVMQPQKAQAEGKHIVIFCPALTRVRGGIERVVSLLTFRFAKDGLRVTVITDGRPDVPPRPLYPIDDSCAVLHVQPRNIEATRKLIMGLGADALLILASGPVVKMFVEISNKLRVPCLLSERAHPHWALTTYWGETQREAYFDTYQMADIVAVQLPSFKSSFAEKPPRNLIVLPNPLQDCLTIERADDLKVVVCVGRIAFNQKRQDLLLDAFALVAAAHPDWRLLFVGDAKDGSDDVLRQRIETLALTDQVKVQTATGEIMRIYHEAAFIVMPSRFEGFPNVLAEAMMTGLPAIGFQACPGVNELIVDGENGLLLEEESPEALAEAMRALINDAPRRCRMGAAAAAGVRERYSTENALNLWSAAVEQLFKCERKPAYHKKLTALRLSAKHFDPRYWIIKQVIRYASLSEGHQFKIIASPHRFFSESKRKERRLLRHFFGREESFL